MISGLFGMQEDVGEAEETRKEKDNFSQESGEAKWKAEKAKLRGDAALKRARYAAALSAYTQARGFDPNDPTLLSKRSLCFIQLGEAKHALIDARDCIALRPDWSKAWYREGAALHLLQRFEEAAISFYEGVKLEPENEELVHAFREAFEAARKFRQ
ncbi:heat shock protein sti1 homolog [Rhodamnia argentea]|uniref:Heat shock protein sti1 homolog n=1 Tax=Rhodamnia argentea TaxID=178133 RepID=A0ABM3HIA5_9MYRT|nr:heat shock protein sti1 homolog [Rhodamnia argentea]